MPTLEPVGPDFVDTARRRAHAQREIDAPVAAVWELVDDQSTWTSWFRGMTRCEVTSEEDRGLDSTRIVQIDKLRADERIVRHEPERAWGFTVVGTNIPMARRLYEQLELEPRDDDRTLVAYTGAFDPHWLTTLAAGRVQRSMEETWSAALDGLAAHVTD